MSLFNTDTTVGPPWSWFYLQIFRFRKFFFFLVGYITHGGSTSVAQSHNVYSKKTSKAGALWLICETVETSIWADYILTSWYPQTLILLDSWKSLTIPILNFTLSFDWPIGLSGLVPLHLPDIHPNPLRSTHVSRDLDSLRMQQLLPFHLDLSKTVSLKVDVTVIQPGPLYHWVAYLVRAFVDETL